MATTLTQTTITVYISGKDYSKYMQFPFKVSNLLDEQLDEASLTLIGVPDKIFKPLTAVTVTVTSGQTSKTYSMLVAEDKADEIPSGSGKYKHELYLIEQTKFLECFVVRSLGFVNPLSKKYRQIPAAPSARLLSGGIDFSGLGELVYPELTTPIEVGYEISLPAPIAFIYSENDHLGVVQSLLNFPNRNDTRIVIKDANGIILQEWNYYESHISVNTGQSFTAPTTNWLLIEYYVGIVVTAGTSNKDAYYKFEYYVAVGDFEVFLTDWNARTVIRRALICTETLRKGEVPRFRLEGDIPYCDANNNPIEFFGDFATYEDLENAYPTANAGDLAWANNTCYRWSGTEWENNSTTYPLTGLAKELHNIETPEFQFTQSTLREVLQEVGRYIHAEPRLLDDGVITFDKLGSGELSTFTEDNYASKSYQQGVDRYATNLYSTVNNLVNSINYANGVMVEPYSNGYKTVRTEDVYVRLEDTNVIIQTQYPIRGIRKLECGYVDNFGTPPFDITSFVYESAEYQRLSSYEGAYPMAKAWALYYTIGQKNVYGLNFKEQTATFEAFKNYAILNILNAVTGSSVGWTDTANNNYMTKLAFRITYEPIYSATAQQSKSYIGDLDKPATMVYNQAQNMVESHYFGENMKGAIARLGNVDKVLTYVKNGLFTPPQVGQIMLDENDEYYISAVATEYFPFYTKFSMSLSKDFNRYSDYVKVNSEKRLYEVSERQAFDSHITYKDYVVIGDNNYESINDGLLGTLVVLKEIFTQDGLAESISLATLQGKDRLGNNLQEVVLPVQKSALGNSALFTVKYKDNYSAGDNVVRDVDNNLWQNGVAYGDLFGNVEYLDFTFWLKMGTEPYNVTKQTEIGNALPILVGNPFQVTISTASQVGDYASGSIPLWIKKGSTEIPTLDYQMDFVTNRSNIIIGSAIVKNFSLISGTNNASHKAKLYVLNKRINKFDKVIDVSNGTPIEDSNWIINFDEKFFFKFVSKSSSVEGISWAIVDGSTNELLIGCNKTITNTNQIFDGLKMFIKHDIFKDKINN